MQRGKYLLYAVIFFVFIPVSKLHAQGPKLSYLYHPNTQLSWASCYVYLDGGSRQKIPFLPMINYKRAPCGIEKYMRDINVKGPIVFIGNGIAKEGEYDCYGDIDVNSKIVMFCYDFPDSIHAELEGEISKEHRIDDAVSRGAAAIVLFSYEEEYPFLYYLDTEIENIPEIPIIAIQRNAAVSILASAGIVAEDIFREWRETGSVKSEELICKLDLRIDGNFDRTETENFLFVFRKELISSKDMRKLEGVNERSVKFILDLFKSEQLGWDKAFTGYFRDYDSKLFYTHHWGKGLSSSSGIFIVYDGSIPDYGLAVHENAHSLINSNWSGTTSFMNEGIAMYAEAMATEKDRNHQKTIEFLIAGELLPLKRMVAMNIGSDEGTEVAYPASGSYVGYLIESNHLGNFKDAFQLESRSKEDKEKESTWEKVFGKSLNELEMDWLDWLKERYE